MTVLVWVAYAAAYVASMAWAVKSGLNWLLIVLPILMGLVFLLLVILTSAAKQKRSERGGGVKVTEGVSGLWHYHLSEDDSKTKALCGATVMNTSTRLEDWGLAYGEHFPKRPTYCKECDLLMRESSEPLTPWGEAVK
jgi:hypothetical protein